MYVLYVDAAGTAELADQSKVYVVAGLCVHEGTWFAVDKRLATLKSRYGLDDVELHVKDYNLQIREQDEIPDWLALAEEDRRQVVVERVQEKIRKLSRAIANGAPADVPKLERKRGSKREYLKRIRPFAHMPRSQRTLLLQDTLDLVGSHDGVRLFAEAVDKAHLLKAAGQRSPQREAFTQVVSRFDQFLIRENEMGTGVDNGLVVMDHEGEQREAFLQDLVPGYRTRGYRWGTLKHVIDIPFFAPSQLLPGVQLVDACAYAIRRYVEFRHKSEFEEENLRRIYHRFDRAGPRLHGLRHYCPLGCDCMICSERDRRR